MVMPLEKAEDMELLTLGANYEPLVPTAYTGTKLTGSSFGHPQVVTGGADRKNSKPVHTDSRRQTRRQSKVFQSKLGGVLLIYVSSEKHSRLRATEFVQFQINSYISGHRELLKSQCVPSSIVLSSTVLPFSPRIICILGAHKR